MNTSTEQRKQDEAASLVGPLINVKADRYQNRSCPGKTCKFAPILDSDDNCYYHDKSKIPVAQRAIHEACSRCEIGQKERNLCRYCQHLRIYHFLVCIPDSGRRKEVYPVVIRWHTTREICMRAITGCLMCRNVLTSVQLWANAYGSKWERLIAHSVFGRGRDLRVRLAFRTQFIGGGAAVNKTPLPSIVVRIEEVAPTTLRRTSDIQFRSFGVITRASGPEFDTAPVVGPKVLWETVRRHLENCADYHGHFLSPFHPLRRLPAGFYVVDVRNYCITEPPPNCQYIALSYVWGKQHPGQVELQLTRDNLHQMTTRGYLQRKPIPATIADAMIVCSKLDVQYLWVDRLCIVQDGYAHKESQINAMGTIYSSAYLTICAVSSVDSSTGLFGVGKTNRPFTQSIFTIAGVRQVLIFPSIDPPNDRRREQTWWKRAWTYQEYQLSTRKLYFATWQTELTCDACSRTFSEGHTQGAVNSKKLLTAWPMKGYWQAIERINTRECTDDADILNAIRGIFEYFYDNLDLFHYGLPTVDFDEALLWATVGPAHRRASQTQFEFPSWTWARANSKVEFPVEFCGTLVQWYRWAGEDGFVPTMAGRSLNSPSWEDEVWPPPSHPSLYLAAAWSLRCIESTIPSAISLTSTFRSLQSELRKRWPKYSNFLNEAFPDERGVFMRSEEQEGRNQTHPTTIVTRTTTALLLVEPFNNNQLTPLEFSLSNKDDETIIGALRLDGDKRVIGHGIYNFIALSVAPVRAIDLQRLLRLDEFLGSEEFPSSDPEQWIIEKMDPLGYRNTTDAERRRATSPEVTLRDGENKALFPPPIVNVMMVKWEEGFAHRLGIGWVLLTQWAKVKSDFQTIFLR